MQTILKIGAEGSSGDDLEVGRLFDDSRPLYVDIGCGKGRVLVEQPLGDRFNYIGIEKRKRHIDLIATRLQKRCIGNVRLIFGEALAALTGLFVDNSVHCYSILFPDPWHKKRHKKRRLVTDELVIQMARTLERLGWVWVVSDHQEYFEVICERFQASPLFKQGPTQEIPDSLSHFEIKYLKQKRPIYRAAFQRLLNLS